MTDEQDFQNCFIAVATRFATPDEIKSWRASGQGPYEYVQKNAPNPALNQARIDAFKACWITVAADWPSEAIVQQWIDSGLSAYEFVQKQALNPLLDAKEQEIRDLHVALEKTENPTATADTTAMNALRTAMKGTL